MQIQITQEFLFGCFLFATVALLAYSLSGVVFRKDPVSRRLRQQHDGDAAFDKQLPGGAGVKASAATATVVPMMERIGAVAARPFMPKSAVKQSSIRKQLMHAGIYSAQAMELVVGLKVILLCVGFVVGYALGALIGGGWVVLLLFPRG